MDEGRAGRGKTEQDWTSAGGDRTRDGTMGQEQPTGTSFIILKLFLLSFSFFFFPIASFLQSTPIGEAGWGVSNADGTTYCSYPPWEVGGATDVYLVECRHA